VRAAAGAQHQVDGRVVRIAAGVARGDRAQVEPGELLGERRDALLRRRPSHSRSAPERNWTTRIAPEPSMTSVTSPLRKCAWPTETSIALEACCNGDGPVVIRVQPTSSRSVAQETRYSDAIASLNVSLGRIAAVAFSRSTQ